MLDILLIGFLITLKIIIHSYTFQIDKLNISKRKAVNLKVAGVTFHAKSLTLIY